MSGYDGSEAQDLKGCSVVLLESSHDLGYDSAPGSTSCALAVEGSLRTCLNANDLSARLGAFRGGNSNKYRTTPFFWIPFPDGPGTQ